MTTDAGVDQAFIDAERLYWQTPGNPETAFKLYDFDLDDLFSYADAVTSTDAQPLFYPGLSISPAGSVEEIEEYF